MVVVRGAARDFSIRESYGASVDKRITQGCQGSPQARSRLNAPGAIAREVIPVDPQAVTERRLSDARRPSGSPRLSGERKHEQVRTGLAKVLDRPTATIAIWNPPPYDEQCERAVLPPSRKRGAAPTPTLPRHEHQRAADDSHWRGEVAERLPESIIRCGCDSSTVAALLSGIAAVL